LPLSDGVQPEWNALANLRPLPAPASVRRPGALGFKNSKLPARPKDSRPRTQTREAEATYCGVVWLRKSAWPTAVESDVRQLPRESRVGATSLADPGLPSSGAHRSCYASRPPPLQTSPCMSYNPAVGSFALPDAFSRLNLYNTKHIHQALTSSRRELASLPPGRHTPIRFAGRRQFLSSQFD